MSLSGTATALLQAVGLGLLGAVALHVFYRALEFRWPESYIGTGDSGVYRLLASPMGYLAFRALPVYVVCAVVAVSTVRAGANPVHSVTTVVGVHAAHTNLLALWRDMRRGGPAFRHRLPIVLVRIGGLAVMAAAAALAVITRTQVQPLIPPLVDMSNNLFTALVAGVIGAYLVKVSAGGSDIYSLLARSRSQVPEEYWELARDLAELHGADPTLLRAVMLVENIQRPPWVRRLERVKAIVVPSGTYGIMQVRAEHPISDEESIRRAAKLLANESVIGRDGVLSYRRIRAVANTYNPDPAYPDLLSAACNYVQDAR